MGSWGRGWGRMLAGGLALGLTGVAALPGVALGQRANQNAVAGSSDAFGTTMGMETAGIYTDADTRGFSPLDAGNARVDGVYYDPVGVFVLPVMDTTTIRVGTAARGFPFQAPTGIVDYQFKPFQDKLGATVGLQHGAYDGYLGQGHVRVPVIPGKFGIGAGLAYARFENTDGSWNRSLGSGIRPYLRLGDVDIAGFYARADYFHDHTHVLLVPTGSNLPEFPEDRRYLGQAWADGKWHDEHFGATVKAKLSERFSLRAGAFRSREVRASNYSDIYYITGPDNAADHQLIADPRREKQSTSGEAILAVRLDNGSWQNRVFGGYRQRVRDTQNGGSRTIDFGPARYGVPDPRPDPQFAYGALSTGHLRQSSLMLGYLGGVKGLFELNLGVQKARYRARAFNAVTGQEVRSSLDPWLYNATATVELSRTLSAYIGTQRGLEDRGVAPDTASNRNEQLPATLATQYEGGLRWAFPGGQLVVNAFQITKPYFSYDNAKRFIELGMERHRGAEASLSGTFGRLTLLGGVVVMKRGVTGAAVTAGVIGGLPAGIPAWRGRVDAHYRTRIFGGLTPTATVFFKGSRAVGSRPQAALGGQQLMLPTAVTVDLGLRQNFTLGAVQVSARAVAENVLDSRIWRVAAGDTLFRSEGRRFLVYLTGDF